MNYFIVFQNKSFKQEHKGGFLWAPTKDSSGKAAKFHWESLLKCEKGDIIFSVINNWIVARAVVEEKAFESLNPFHDSTWAKKGRIVKVAYYFDINSVKIAEQLDRIKHLLPKKYSPINPKTGRGNMGYLYPISNELGEVFDYLINDTGFFDNKSPVFTVSAEEAEIINEVFAEAGLTEGKVILIEEDVPTIANKPKARVSKAYAKKTDFISKVKEDTIKGIKAEQLVVSHEKMNLIASGREDLAEKVKWVAKEADGYGFDVLSFDENGNEKYIEVKGTTLTKTTPFIISKNELETSIKKDDQYWIYRVFYLDDQTPKFYKIKGRVDKNFELEPSNYTVYIK